MGIVEFTCKGKNGGAKAGSVAATGTTNLLVFKALSKAVGKTVKAETPLIQKPKEELSLDGNSTNGTVVNGTAAADAAAANASSAVQNASSNTTGANGTR